jgi:hypothetical protein
MPSDDYNFGDVFQKIYVAKQKPPPIPVSENMKVVLQSFPSLGQVTSVRGKSVTLTTVLEIPKSRASESWEVSVWHSVDDSSWGDILLLPIQEASAPQTLQTLDDSMYRFYFSSSIAFEASLKFTLKFRHSSDADWRWIRDEQGLNDGLIVNTPVGLSSNSLSDLIPDINSKDWTIKSQLSQSPRTSLWSLEAAIAPANQEDSTYRDILIGTPFGTFARWFSLVRLWSPWLAPRHGKSHFSLDKDGVLCCFLSPQGKTLVFLAVSGIGHVLPVFRSESDGKIQVHVRTRNMASISLCFF